MNTDNKQYVDDRKNFVNEPVLQLTLRRLQENFLSKKFWIGFAAVMVLLAIMGPFGTIDLMDAPNRLVYWSVISLSTFFVGGVFSIFIGIFCYKQGIPEWLSWGIAGLCCGLPVGTLVWILNIYVFDMDISSKYSFPVFIAISTLISLAIVILNILIGIRDKDAIQVPANAKHSPTFMRRLPTHIGKNILSLEAQDHYVNVTTDKGSALVLIRLADAIAELEGLEGLRIHRSHWVAADAISRTKRENGKLLVELTNGTSLPVSRTYAKSLKEKFMVESLK